MSKHSYSLTHSLSVTSLVFIFRVTRRMDSHGNGGRIGRCRAGRCMSSMLPSKFLSFPPHPLPSFSTFSYFTTLSLSLSPSLIYTPSLLLQPPHHTSCPPPRTSSRSQTSVWRLSVAARSSCTSIQRKIHLLREHPLTQLQLRD